MRYRVVLRFSHVVALRLPQALAKGEWIDKTPPLVDSLEFRGLMTDLQDVFLVLVRAIQAVNHRLFEYSPN
eukprot:5650803-Amphidinium_carterae.1